MIPQYSETIAMMEREFPGWGWLLRNNHDERGKYFFHLHGQQFNPEARHYEKSFKAWADTPDLAAWQVYCDAMAVVH